MREFMNVPEILQILFKHKWKVLIGFVATVTTVMIATFLISPTYESTANLLVKYGREFVYLPEVGDVRTAQQPKPDMVGIINAETQILTSQDLIHQVINKVGAKNLYPNFVRKADSQEELIDMARNRFMNDLSVKGLTDSGVIQVSFDHQNPKMTARVVNTLIDAFKEKHLQVFGDPKTSSFLEEKAAVYHQKLRDTEQKLQDLKMQNMAYNLDEQRTLLLHQRADLDATLKETQSQIAELGKKLGALQSQLGSVTAQARMDTGSDRYSIMDNAKKNLLDLQVKEQEVLKKYTDSSQVITQIREEKKAVQNFIAQQDEELRNRLPAGNRVYDELQSQIVTTKANFNAAEAKAAALKTQVDDLDARLRNLAGPENQLRDLQRDLTTTEQNYQRYSTKLEEARILEDMNRLRMTSITVIQAATIPADPIKPRRKLNIMIGILFGGLLGIGLAFIAEFLSQCFSTPGSVVRRLGVPVLAVIPYRPNYLTR